MMGLRAKRVDYLAMEKHIPTMRQLQIKSGAPYSQVRMLWNGEQFKFIPVEALVAVARVLGVRAIDLLEETEE